MDKLHFEYIGVSDTNTGWPDSAGPNYGWVDGFVRGFNIEFRHKETGEVDYDSCIWEEGNIEDYFQKQIDDWGDLGFVLFETERSKGYEPTGRAVFRGYGRVEWDPEERDEYVELTDVNEFLEKMHLSPNTIVDPHKSIFQNTHKADLGYPMGDFIDEAIDRLQEYIEKNFSLDRTARGLVHDILQHAKLPPNDLETKTAMLSSLLHSIGIEKEEIEDVLLQRERGEERE